MVRSPPRAASSSVISIGCSMSSPRSRVAVRPRVPSNPKPEKPPPSPEKKVLKKSLKSP